MTRPTTKTLFDRGRRIISCLGIAFAFIGVSVGPPSSTAATNPVQYTIEGVAHEYSKEDLPAGKLSSDFTVVVKGEQWLVNATPWAEFNYLTNDSIVTPVLFSQSEVMSCDGTNSYFVSANSIHGNQLPIKGEAEFAKSIAPIRGRRGLMSIWYAFASHHYLSETRNETIRPLDIVPQRPLPLARATSLELIPQPPGLPKSIAIRRESPLQSGGSYWRVEKLLVTATTNVGAYTFPAQIEANFSNSLLPTNAWYRVELVAHRITLNARTDVFVPPLKGPHGVTYRDVVLHLGSNNVKQGLTLITNLWPQPEVYEAHARKVQQGLPRPTPRRWYAGLVIAALLVPLALFAGKRLLPPNT